MLLSMTIGVTTSNYAAPPINSVHDGLIIPGGTYYNTSNSSTKFINSGSGGLWLQGGSTVRGLEVNTHGDLTNNGGAIQLFTPGQVVRVDGNIDVNATVDGRGAYVGDGGKVLVNAAYLFQNGNITGLGVRGGHVTVNVNSATFGPQSKIDVNGSPDGIGGTIRINATGVVDIKNGALLNTTGVPLPGVDSNVIEIIGPMVNNEGKIVADGVRSNLNQNFKTSDGGTIRLVATGNLNLKPVTQALATSKALTETERHDVSGRLQWLANTQNGNIRNAGIIRANGGEIDILPYVFGGGGGRIFLSASKQILNQSSGSITANGGNFGRTGGNGGQISLISGSGRYTQNDGSIEANGGLGADVPSGGLGGNGGSIRAVNVSNTGVINALGGIEFGIDGGTGGAGGNIKMVNLINSGDIGLRGGGASGDYNAQGGNGGHFQAVNVTGAGFIDASGGYGYGDGASYGGNGGRVDITNASISQSGGILSYGGAGKGGGNGGIITFINVKNAGAIIARGGSTFPEFGTSLPGGNGGMIKAIHAVSIDPALVSASGGQGSNGGPDGSDGVIIGF